MAVFDFHCPVSRLSSSPFVFCEIYGYCMTFEETASPKGLFSHQEAIVCLVLKKLTKELRNSSALFKPIKKPHSYIHSMVLYLTQQTFSPEYWYM